MTRFILGVIFCVLVVIARELRLLRRQRETPPISVEQRHRTSVEYKPHIFTFQRSGWALRTVDLGEWLGTLAAVLIWFKFVLPLLPAQPWIKYPITIVGLLILGFLAIMVVELLLGLSLDEWMDSYDKRVHNRVFSPEEREYMEEPDADSAQIEEMYRQKGL